MVRGRWGAGAEAATLALVIAVGAGVGALLVEAARGPGRYYVSAVIALDLLVVMVVAGLAAVYIFLAYRFALLPITLYTT